METKKVQWQILEITKWEEGTLKSERFVAGDCEWIIVAKLKNVCGEDYLSLFLRCCTDKGARDYGCRDIFADYNCRDIFADYSFIVVNRLWGAKSSLIEGGKRHFRVGGKGWGFKSLIRLGDLLKPLKGFLANDDILIRAHVSTVKQESTWLSDLDDRTREEYTPRTHHQAGAAAADSDTTEETDIGSEAPLIRAHVSKEESTWLSDFEDRTQEEDTPGTHHQAGAAAAAAAADSDTTEETDINSEASADHQEEEEEASDSDTSEETDMNSDAPADHQEEEEEASDSDTSEETHMNSDAPADHQEEEEEASDSVTDEETDMNSDAPADHHQQPNGVIAGSIAEPMNERLSSGRRIDCVAHQDPERLQATTLSGQEEQPTDQPDGANNPPTKESLQEQRNEAVEQPAATVLDSATEGPPLSSQLAGHVNITEINDQSSQPRSITSLLSASRNLRAELSAATSNMKCAADDSSASLVQQQREKMIAYLNMPLVEIHKTDSFEDVEETALLFADPSDETTVKGLILELKRGVSGSMHVIETSHATEASVAQRNEDVEARLVHRQKQLSCLEGEFFRLGEEGKKLDAEIQQLIARKIRVEDQTKTTVGALRKTRERACKELEEAKEQSNKRKRASENRLVAEENLAQFNTSWKLLKSTLGL
ncbi:unnamed protein product [Linum tenue]|uniref:MATH domain-containing protein n=1 Tax=Linum tenue TaxID=586396 RepID=A0AAV0S1F1_9ROSI|nr:unnamed protein product [Linum tenue]